MENFISQINLTESITMILIIEIIKETSDASSDQTAKSKTTNRESGKIIFCETRGIF